MDDDRFEQLLRETARGYRVPPPTPREEMWQAIHGARRTRQGRQSWNWWPLGIAAALVLGVAIGRLPWQDGLDGSATVAVVASESAVDAYDVVALEHLRRTETFLAVFLVEARTGEPRAWVREPARELLTTTRLLLDSPVGDHPEMETLLRDLELVLVQIAQLRVAWDRDDEELDLIDAGIEQRGVLLKLRAAIDAGSAVPVAQGVL